LRRLRFVIGTDPPAADDAHVRAAAGPPKKTRRRKRRRVYRKLFEENAAEERGTFRPVESVHFHIGDGTLKERYIRNHGGQEVPIRIVRHWPFLAFGTLTTVSVHLAGADRVDSLVGLNLRGFLPNDRPLRGGGIRHRGESAVLLCGDPAR